MRAEKDTIEDMCNYFTLKTTKTDQVTSTELWYFGHNEALDVAVNFNDGEDKDWYIEHGDSYVDGRLCSGSRGIEQPLSKLFELRHKAPVFDDAILLEDHPEVKIATVSGENGGGVAAGVPPAGAQVLAALGHHHQATKSETG